MASKIIRHLRILNGVDFFRKSFLAVLFHFSRVNVFRALKALYYFKNASVVLGKNVIVHGLCYDISVGRKTIFYDNCIFEFSDVSKVKIGSNVLFSYGVLFCCREHIVVGDDVQIGEYTSLRDATHRYDGIEKPMKYLPDISKSIIIGNNVWIGRGCLISPGTVIEDGVVVAANSVVKGKLERDGIYGGVPARFIKSRIQEVSVK